MALATTITDVNGNLRKVYNTSDAIMDAFKAERNELLDRIPFVRGLGSGDKTETPIVLSSEGSFTHLLRGGGITNFKDPIPMNIKKIENEGAQIWHNVAVEDNLFFSTDMESKAFKNIVGLVIGHSQRVMKKKVEETAWYGLMPKGRLDTSVNTDATTTVVTFTAYHFAPKMWLERLNAKVECFVLGSTSSTAGTRIGGDANLYTISNIDLDTGALTLTGSAQDIADLDAYLAGVADVDIWFQGQIGNEAAGVFYMAALTTGTFKGINVAAYPYWKPASYAASGALTRQKIVRSVTRLGQRALSVTDKNPLLNFVSLRAWDDVMLDMLSATQRHFDYSYDKDKLVDGSGALELSTSTGRTQVISSAFVKPKDGVMFPTSIMRRTGESDVVIRDYDGVGPFTKIQSSNYSALQYYSSQAMFPLMLMWMLQQTDITVT